MRWLILAVGKPRLAYARDGITEYLSRLRNVARLEIDYLRPSESVREGEQLLARSEGCFRLVLDERGRQFTSREFAQEVERLQMNSCKACAVLVGGSDGLSPVVRERADLLWALGKITLQHELALVVALEQVYRAQTLMAGLPYHRD